MTAPWARQEPDEPEPDWMLRVQLSQLAAAGLIRIADETLTERNAS